MKSDRILLAHGSGGRLSRELVSELFLPEFFNEALNALDDSAEVRFASGRLAFTTDSFVVQPLEFPGGDIGRLAVCGTVNDLAMKGSTPKVLSAAFIMEEGLDIELLKRVTKSMREAAAEAGVNIVTGDTKVVGRGMADNLFITTAGIGIIPEDVNISGSYARETDAVILSGNLGEHGIAVLNARNNLGFESDIKSDVCPLNSLVEAVLEASKNIHVLRDLTRGGLASALNEIAEASGCLIEIEESLVPVSEGISAACALLGLDPLYIANEGKLCALVQETDAATVLNAMRKHRYGTNARIVGRVLKGAAKVRLLTRAGGARIVLMPEGEQLPRIC